jgi:hypothetical protein
LGGNWNSFREHILTIEYTYEIASVDAQARCMEVIYTAAGHPTMRVGARLPYEGEALEAVVAMFAPVRYWEELITPVSIPQVGQTGVIAPVVPQAPQPVETTAPSPVIDSRLVDL